MAERATGFWKTARGFGRTASGLVKRATGFWKTARGFGRIASGLVKRATGFGEPARGFVRTASGLVKRASGFGGTARSFVRTASGLVKRATSFRKTASGFWGVVGICGVGGRGEGTSVLGAVTGASRVGFQGEGWNNPFASCSLTPNYKVVSAVRLEAAKGMGCEKDSLVYPSRLVLWRKIILNLGRFAETTVSCVMFRKISKINSSRLWMKKPTLNGWRL